MCELSSNQFSTTDLGNCFQIGFCPMIVRHRLQTGLNSLFRNILAVSPCGSIFYMYPCRSIPDNSLRINILGDQPKKMLDPVTTFPGSTAPSAPRSQLGSPTGHFLWIDS